VTSVSTKGLMTIEFNEALIDTLALINGSLFDEVVEQSLLIELSPPLRGSEANYSEFLSFTWKVVNFSDGKLFI